jgi:hypothetical protein
MKCATHEIKQQQKRKMREIPENAEKNTVSKKKIQTHNNDVKSSLNSEKKRFSFSFFFPHVTLIALSLFIDRRRISLLVCV